MPHPKFERTLLPLPINLTLKVTQYFTHAGQSLDR